jgi:hypothetical protein
VTGAILKFFGAGEIHRPPAKQTQFCDHRPASALVIAIRIIVVVIVTIVASQHS